MVIPKIDPRDEEFKEFVQQIAVICLSEEFANLRQELERIYCKSELDNAMQVAFQDALYSILAQEEAAHNIKSQAF